MVTEHTVKSYDDELKNLNQTIAQMGGLAEAQLQSAIEALVRRDSDLAAQVVQSDTRIDELEHQISIMAVRMLALRQPMAQDLREVVAALKISGDFERIGDHATNVAETVHFLVLGRPIATLRPKGDNTSFSVVEPPAPGAKATEAAR